MEKALQKRKRRIEFIKQRLLRKGLPRVQISIILLLTALAGFLTSYSLLHAGVSSMALRYPIAILIAYCVFLLLLRVWIWLQKNSPDFDLPGLDFGSSSSVSTGSSNANFEFGGGGDFGGAGAGGSWGESGSSSSISADSSILDNVSFDLDSEELGLLILAVVAIIGGMLASLYIIYIAPVLLAEILVDGVLIAGLYKRVKGIEQTHWLKTAVKRTIAPAVLVAIFFTIAGFALQKAVPEARSVGEVWSYIKAG
ncbi:MAG TPA: hypothetical protein VK892_03535 [Pyrinomonadaceae bacterium]|nr:hypothetical protein [Pyrinomonadaceae bacterium]